MRSFWRGIRPFLSEGLLVDFKVLEKGDSQGHYTKSDRASNHCVKLAPSFRVSVHIFVLFIDKKLSDNQLSLFIETSLSARENLELGLDFVFGECNFFDNFFA